MNLTTRSQQGNLLLPATQIYTLLDGQLTLFLRAWGSQDYNQKFIDEVSHYLSSAQADIDVTSPFEYHENMTTLANKTRIAVLLAHDLFFKTDNVNELTVGFEAAVFFQTKTELAWSSVGRFGLKKYQKQNVNTLFEAGADRDHETLLPVELIGVEKDIEIQTGSLYFEKEMQLLLYSCYNGEIICNNQSAQPLIFEARSLDMTYWYSLMIAE